MIAPGTDDPDARLRGLKVLLVDDSETIREVGLRLLERLGCQATAVDDGEAAVEELRRHAYDVVLMDLQMPTLDGSAATEIVRRTLPADQQPFIVALTGSESAEDRRGCLTAGMDDFLAKPYRIEDLRQVLERATGSRVTTNRSTPRPATVVLDPTVMEEMAQRTAAGHPEFLAGLIATYGRGAEDLVRQIRTAATSGDLEGLRRATHALKGTSAILGARVLPDLCDRLAELGAGAPELSKLVAELELAHAEVLEAMTAIVATHDVAAPDGPRPSGQP